MSKIFVKRNALLLTLYLFCINDSLKSTNVAISYGISVEKSRLFGKIKVTFLTLFSQSETLLTFSPHVFSGLFTY